MINLDTADRVEGITERIRNKDILFKFYHEFYSKFADCLKYCPSNGLALEIGSDFGFLKEIIPNVVTSDVIPYKIVDIVMDASNLPFDDSSLKYVFMLNTLHHIPDSTSLFNEIERCLKPDGRMLIIDQYNGWFSKIIYRHLHHEPYDPNATSWCFQPSGPLSGANGALCWIIFYRDRALFEQLYPTLKIINISPNTPLRYWLSGGLKPWQLIPGTLFEISTKLDNWLSKKLPEMSSFVEVELVKSAY